MVGRLVHEQDVPRADEHAREVAAPALAARELAHPRVPVDIAHQAPYDRARRGVGGPCVVGQAADHGMGHALVVRKRVVLAEQPHGGPATQRDAAPVGLQRPGEDPQERGLAVPVAPDDADPVPLIDAERLVLEHALSGPLVPKALAPDEDRHRCPQ